jgi:hypothetical protein
MGATMAMVDLSKPDTTESERVMCFNDKYGFYLERAAGANSFVVKSIDQDTSPIRSNMPRWLNDCLLAPVQLAVFPAKDIISHPNFKIERVIEPTADNHQTLTVYFDCAIPPTQKGATGGFDGYFTLLSGAKWVINQYECRLKQRQFGYRGEIEYEGISDGYPIPKRVSFAKVSTKDHSIIERRSFDYERFQFRDTPVSEFTLPAFGLPDPLSPPIAVRGGNTSYLLFALSFAALAASVVAGVIAGRLRRSHVASPLG